MNIKENESIKELEEKFDELVASMDDDFFDDELEELGNIIVLHDNNGEEAEFVFLDLIKYNNENYVVLLPAGYDPVNDDDFIIFKVEEFPDSEEEFYTNVDDEATSQAVFEIYLKGLIEELSDLHN